MRKKTIVSDWGMSCAYKPIRREVVTIKVRILVNLCDSEDYS